MCKIYLKYMTHILHIQLTKSCIIKIYFLYKYEIYSKNIFYINLPIRRNIFFTMKGYIFCTYIFFLGRQSLIFMFICTDIFSSSSSAKNNYLSFSFVLKSLFLFQLKLKFTKQDTHVMIKKKVDINNKKKREIWSAHCFLRKVPFISS